MRNGKDYYLKVEEDGTNYGKALDDGTIFITELCFDKALEYGSPAVLASTLHHEGSHFDDLVHNGWTSHEQAESNALRRGLKADDDIGLESDETEQSKAKLAAIGALASLFGRTPAFPNEGLSEANMKEWGDIQSKLRAIRKQQARLDRRLAAGQDWHDSLNDGDDQAEQTGDCGTAGSSEVPEVGPAGPRVPECLQRDGGRCIRWR